MSKQLVNGLLLPPLLVSLIREGRWRHPGDAILAEVIPFLQEPVDFLDPVQMEQYSSAHLADDPEIAALFHEVRGSTCSEPVNLPWRDVERSLYIAVNRNWGDDIAIALDFRTDPAQPSVIANDWHSDPTGCRWCEVAPSFPAFAARLGLCSTE